ncbi:MAG: hypothetical protein KDD51_10425 [Bdellovibrionales bacterium]|nr:hypothetical protein [Bdellovibrionales bacterium]
MMVAPSPILLTLTLLIALSNPLAYGAQRKTAEDSALECALRVIRQAAKKANPADLDRLRNEIVNGTEIIPNDRPALEPVQLMVIKALSTGAESGLSADELLDRMGKMGFLDKVTARDEVRRRSDEQIRTILLGMSSRNEGRGYYVRADWSGSDVRFFPTAFATKELENTKWFVGKVREITDRTRRVRSARAATIRQWFAVLKEKEIGKLESPKIGRATAVVMAHMHPELADYVTNLAGDAVYGDGLGTPSDMSQVYRILRDLHTNGYAERQFESGARRSWIACSTGYVGTDTSAEMAKLHAWTTMEGEMALAQWFRFHYAVLEAKAPQD